MNAALSAAAGPRRLTPRCTNSPQTQTVSASRTSKIPSQNGAFFPKWAVARLNSQTAVASMGKPIAILNFSIQAPGRGKNLARFGRKLNSTYGAASPTPIMRNIRATTGADCAKAKPSATPRNGAVQGVAKAVARTPLKKAPAFPCFDASPAAAPIARPLKVTSKRPNRFSATSVTSTVMITRNCGF